MTYRWTLKLLVPTSISNIQNLWFIVFTARWVVPYLPFSDSQLVFFLFTYSYCKYFFRIDFECSGPNLLGIRGKNKQFTSQFKYKCMDLYEIVHYIKVVDPKGLNGIDFYGYSINPFIGIMGQIWPKTTFFLVSRQ